MLVAFKNEMDYILVFFIAFNLPSSKKDIKRISFILLGFFVLILLFSMLNYYIGIKGMSFAEIAPGVNELHGGSFQPGYRLTGFFGDPNLFACLLILFSALILSFYFYSRQKIIRLVLAICLFFQVVVLILSGSRGGYVGFISMIIAFLFIVLIKKLMSPQKLVVCIGLILILIMAVYVIYPVPFMTNIFGRITTDVPLNVQTASSRLEYWKTGIHGFFQSPFFGHGWKTMRRVHNSFISYLANLGLLGFGLYVFIYAKMLTVCYRSLDRAQFTFNNFINISFIAGFIGLLAVMIFILPFSVSHYLFFYAGIVLKYNYLKVKQNE
jgi:O-antigen ligase